MLIKQKAKTTQVQCNLPITELLAEIRINILLQKINKSRVSTMYYLQYLVSNKKLLLIQRNKKMSGKKVVDRN